MMKEEFYTKKGWGYLSTDALAQLLDVTPGWLASNRKSNDPIPFKKFGRFIRYNKSDVQKWIGRKDLELNYMSTKVLAKKLDLSVDWLKHNRLTEDSIPFRRFGRLVRYQQQEVEAWLKKKQWCCASTYSKLYGSKLENRFL